MAEVQDIMDVKRARFFLEPLGWVFIEEWYIDGRVLIQFARPKASSVKEEVASPSGQ